MNGLFSKLKSLSLLERLGMIAGVALAIGPFVTPYMVIATVSYGLLVMGYSYRKIDSKTHGILMGSGVIGDLGLVLILEFQRHAINTAMSFELNPLQQTHVICSSVAAALYLPLMALGLLMFKRPELRSKLSKSHGKMGQVAFFFRTLGFLLMFSMLGRNT